MDDDRASGVDIEQVDDHRNSKFVKIKSEPLRPCKFTLLFGQAKAVSLLHILAAYLMQSVANERCLLVRGSPFLAGSHLANSSRQSSPLLQRYSRFVQKAD